MSQKVSIGRAVAVAALVLLIAPLLIAWGTFLGLEVSPDEEIPKAAELAQQAIGATQYLLTLATGVLGLLGFLMSEKVSGYWNRLSRRRRRGVVVGATCTALSIWTGFVALWVVLSLSADAAVRGGLKLLRVLHAFQVVELAVGVGAIGAVVLGAIMAAEPDDPARLAAGSERPGAGGVAHSQ